MTKDERLAQIAVKQLSLVTVDDARSVGLTADDLGYRCEIGRLVRVRRGVHRLAGAPENWEQHLLAACLAAGLPAVASHESAAFVHRFLGAHQPRRFDITVPWPLNPRLAGVRAHRVSVLDLDDVTQVRGIPVTTAARTVIDLASVVRPERLDAIVNDLLRRRLLTTRALGAAADRVDDSRLRRRMKVVRQLIAAKSGGFHPGDSDPELWMVQTLVAAGLGRPIQQFEVRARGRDYRIDAAYPEHKVGLEYEGEDGHAQPGDLQRDRRRLNDLTALGWDIRFATKETTERELVDDVRAALRRAGAQT